LERALDLRRRVLGPEHPDTLSTTSNLAALYDLEASMRRPRRWTARSSNPTPRVRPRASRHVDVHDESGFRLLRRGQVRAGRYTPEPDFGDQAPLLGPEHPATLASIYSLAVVYEHEGKYAQAEELNRETLEIRRRVLGAEHPATLASMNNLAIATKKRASTRRPKCSTARHWKSNAGC